MDIPVSLATVFPPSSDLLLNLARSQVDEAMLAEIADADFACATLLRAAAEPHNRDLSLASEATLAQGLVSAKVLGTKTSDAAARF